MTGIPDLEYGEWQRRLAGLFPKYRAARDQEPFIWVERVYRALGQWGVPLTVEEVTEAAGVTYHALARKLLVWLERMDLIEIGVCHCDRHQEATVYRARYLLGLRDNEQQEWYREACVQIDENARRTQELRARRDATREQGGEGG